MSSVTDWRRHPGDSLFHSIANSDDHGSVVTRCFGRWPVTDPHVERSPNPPQDERCECCQRLLIDVIRIEQALTELEVMTRDRNIWRSLARGLADRIRVIEAVPA